MILGLFENYQNVSPMKIFKKYGHFFKNRKLATLRPLPYYTAVKTKFYILPDV